MRLQKVTIEDCKEIARQRKGECLSIEYVNANTKLKWKCEHGHEWETTPSSVKNGKSWCPVCAAIIKGKQKRLSIEEMQEIAKSRNGECLSTEYVNNNTKLKWKCEHGHEWEAIPNKIKSGQWCPECAGKNKTKEEWFEEIAEIAKSRNGECLSTEYVNNNTKLKWKCDYGHEWEATPSQIKSGSWCPECAASIGERICREYFEKIFDCEFPKSFPKWLISNKGNQLELDGYCESKAIAFEHHGRQHYTKKGRFYKQASEFKHRLKLDEEKENLCINHGIKLIIVPEISFLTPLAEVFPFLKKEFEKLGIEITKSEDELNINWAKIYASPQKEEFLKIQEIARKRNGECLSNGYVNSKTKMRFRCEHGHEWEVESNKIKSGQWCPICAGNLRSTIEEMQEIAKSRNGECLSTEYVNARTKLKWKCEHGHEWESVPDSIKQGTWCPECAGNANNARAKKRRLGIEEMQELAKSRNGICLSSEYVNANTKLKWKCEHGHEWEATPSSIKSGSWCPICAGTIKSTIEEMQEIARQHKGKCLSTEYVNAHTRLKWKCEYGHEWEAKPNHIKSGSWCPRCSK